MADWEERATAAVASAVRTLTRVRVGGLGRRWDATNASSFILEPPKGRSDSAAHLRPHPEWMNDRTKV
ncbi:hypothetical protein Slala03_25590 [Streptomyces lavendulae subsp. lavendulae]|nr:hypothetical protein Slala03_25590 [Streptomyces lavendulae subsp. lavendulae]GLV97426.1 hypothetical protein Slala05_10580 [Streptomyces lavendulae subsp. lavendulae]GLX36653.1 hypothetical protein Sros01_27260 [Streptomyces roseochromogenus]